MKEKYRKQHIVPQSYLNRFANKGSSAYQIGTRLKTHNGEVKFFKTSVANVAYRDCYYDTNNNKDKKLWEKYLGENFDTLCGKPLERVIASITLSFSSQNILSQEDKRILASIIMSQAIRTPEFLDEQIIKSKVIIENSKELIIESLPDNNPIIENVIKRIEIDEDARKHMIFEGVFGKERFLRFCRALEDKTWVVYFNKMRDDIPFITSDNPVVFTDLSWNSGAMTNLGIANKTVIIFPISPAILISLYPNNFIEMCNNRREYVDDVKFICNINKLIMSRSYIQSFLPEPLFTVVNSQA